MTTEQASPSHELISFVNSVVERARVKEAAAGAADSEELPDLAQLPLWPPEVRAMPNDYARSALFTVRNKREPRQALKNFEIFHIHGDVTISYSGEELRADDDELVWLQVLEFAKHFPLDSPVEFSTYQLCKQLGWPTNGTYYAKAEASLMRLKEGTIKIRSKRLRKLSGLSLIRRFTILDQGTRRARCQVYIEREMFYLFSGNHYTQFLWHKYRKLRPITRRLYDYFGSHKQPFPLKLATFNKLCASNCSRANKWAEMTREACTELVSAGLVQSAWVEDGMIRCAR